MPAPQYTKVGEDTTPNALRNLGWDKNDKPPNVDDLTCCECNGCGACLKSTGVSESPDKLCSACIVLIAIVAWFYVLVSTLVTVSGAYVPVFGPDSVTSAMAAVGLSVGSFASQSIFGGGIPAVIFSALSVVLLGPSANFLLVQNATLLASNNVSTYRNVVYNADAANSVEQIGAWVGLYLFLCVVCSLLFAIHFLVCLGACNAANVGDGPLRPWFERASRMGRLRRQALGDDEQDKPFLRESVALKDLLSWDTAAKAHGNFATIGAMLTLCGVLACDGLAFCVYQTPQAALLPATGGDLALLAFAAGLRLWPFQPFGDVKESKQYEENWCRRAPIVHSVMWIVATAGVAVSTAVFLDDLYLNCPGLDAACYERLCWGGVVHAPGASYVLPYDATRDCASFAYYSRAIWISEIVTLAFGLFFWVAFTFECLALVAVYTPENAAWASEKTAFV